MGKNNEEIIRLIEEALTYHKSGELDHAISIYRKILSLDSMNEIANNNLGIIYVFKENYDKAVEYFLQVLKISPRSVDTYYNLAKAYMLSNDYINAAHVLEKANKLSPKDQQILKNLAMCYKNTCDFERSLINYRQVLNFDENNINILYEIAETYYLMENYERASEFCLKIINREPASWKARGLLADSFFHLMRPKEAIELMVSIIEDYPDRIDFREKVCEYYLETGDFNGALNQYETILSKEPNNINHLKKYREIKELLFSKGEKAFLSELESTYEEKLKLKAKSFFEKEDYNGLIRDFTKELINNSNNLFLLKSIARAFCRVENFEEAEKYYTRYLETDQKDPDIFYENAVVLNRLGKYIDSHKILERLFAQGIKNEQIILLQSNNLENMGLITDAITIIEKNINSINSVNLYVRLGEYYNIHGNTQSAYNIWNKATKIFPEEIYLEYLLCDICYKDENYRQALKHLKKYIDYNVDDFKALEFLSVLLLKLKKPKEAFENWSDIIDKRPKSDNDILVKAKVLLYSERIDEALKQIELVMDKLQGTVEFNFVRGLAFLMTEDYNDCIEFWDKAIEMDKEEFEHGFYFIVKYFDKNKLKNLFKRWNKYDEEITTIRSNI